MLLSAFFSGLCGSVAVWASEHRAVKCTCEHVCIVDLCVCVSCKWAQMLDILCPSGFAPHPASCPPRTLTLGAHQPDMGSGNGKLGQQMRGQGVWTAWLLPHQAAAQSWLWSDDLTAAISFGQTSAKLRLSPTLTGPCPPTLQAQGWQPGSLLLLAPTCITIAWVSLYPTLAFVNGPFITFCSSCWSVPAASCWDSD